MTSKSKDSMVVALLDELGNRFPQYKGVIDKATPYCEKCAELFDKAYPYLADGVTKCKSAWAHAEKNNYVQFAPLVLGIIICFFGGTFIGLIAAFEAVRLCVWKRLSTSVNVLSTNYRKAQEASRKDDAVDVDGNGISDVNEISKKQLLSRKIHVFLRSVDPEEVVIALGQVWGGFLVVVATVKASFAKAITLGASLGEMLDSRLHNPLEQTYFSILPPELKKWSNVAASMSFKIVGGIVALFLRRIIVAFHASIRGASLVTENALSLMKARGMIRDDLDQQSTQVTVLTGLLAFVGFYWQLTNAFGLPFPLNILFLPLSIIEWLFDWFIMFF